VTPESLAASFATTNMRIHGYLRDQHQIAVTPHTSCLFRTACI